MPVSGRRLGWERTGQRTAQSSNDERAKRMGGNAEARNHEAEARREIRRAFAENLTVGEPLFMIEMRGGAVW